ncbi:hypothetical protein [Ruminococcus sp. YRD2003]|uniref:hypothetical protein n=1 Tax=Ruminococcus sp. YRD2003 TaxID=1452313 RepID=UPI00296EAA81
MNSFSPMKKILSCIMKIIVIASAVSGTFLSWYAGRVLDLGYAAEGAVRCRITTAGSLCRRRSHICKIRRSDL